MNKRSKELILELALLSLRYGSADIRAAERALQHGEGIRSSADLFALIRLTTSLADNSSPDDAKAARDTQAVETKPSVSLSRPEFIAFLSSTRSGRDRKRIEAMARRLGIRKENGAVDLVDEIKKRVREMSDVEFVEFSARYKAPAEADQGYLGLANYLLRKDEG